MKETIEVMNNRAALYSLLARVYRTEIDEELLSELKAMRFPKDTGNDNVDEGYQLLHHYLCTLNEASLTHLAVDFARVFLGSGTTDTNAAFPFESVYTSPRGLTMQDARDQVLALYRSQGLDKSSSWREAEDHIALELEFLKVLCLRTAQALQDGDAEEATRQLLTQYNFMQTHIFNWTPRFISDICAYAKTDFYVAIAHITQGFLQEEEALLKEALSKEIPEQEPSLSTEEVLAC